MDADCIVVGAGQAGCAAAYDLAAAGWRVILLDKARSKPCAGGITIKALKRYRFSIDEIVREWPQALHFSWRGRRRLNWPLKQPVCALVERAELDALCRQQAEKKGVKSQTVSSVQHIQQDTSGVTLTVDGEQIRSRWVVAADGAHSPLRRLLIGVPKAAGAYAIEGKVARADARFYPQMQFDFQCAAKGYGWLFPKADHINVGLYVSRLGAALPGKVELVKYCQQTLGTDQVTSIQGFPLGTQMGQLQAASGRVLFAGDALGSCEPLLGEGIYGALLSGQLAATTLLNATDDQTDQIVQGYTARLAEWRHEIIELRRLARLFYATTPLSYGALHHGFRHCLTKGYAAGLTPMQSGRLLFGGKSL